MADPLIGGPSVLFVDDDPALLAGLRRMLRSRHPACRLHFAASAEEALDVLTVEHLDGVVSDMRMPRVDGAELLAGVRRRRPGAVRVILSGQTAPTAAIRAARIAHRFLDKPTPPDALDATIGSIAGLASLPLDADLRAALGALACLPTPLATIDALADALSAPAPSPLVLREAIDGDLGIVAKLCQLASTAFLSVPSAFRDELDILTRLDPAHLRQLVRAGCIAVPPADRVVDRLASVLAGHARRVSTLAAAIHGGPLPPAAALAARLCDVGVLAAAVADVPSAGQAGHGGPAPRTEHDGATLRLASAFLLDLWGLPHPVADLVGRSHPARLPRGGSASAATAIALADALDAEEAGLPGHAGLLQRLEGAVGTPLVKRARALAGTHDHQVRR